MTITLLLMTVAAGFGVGALAGVFGVGGGFLLVPLLTGLLDVPAAVVVGSAGCAVLGPATTALLAHRSRLEDWKFPAVLFGGLSVGVIAGARILHVISDQAPHAVERIVLIVYAVLLLTLGTWTLIDATLEGYGRRLPRGVLNRLAIPPAMVVQTQTSGPPSELSVPVASLTAVIVGLLCGFLGISGGLLTVPLFVYGFGLRTRIAVKASLVTVWLVSLQATAVHAWLDHVNLAIVCSLLLGGTVGARVASTASRRLAPVVLRFGFAGLLLGSAVFVLIRLALLA